MMTTDQRTDQHRPAEIDPAQYEYVGAFVHDPPCDPETGDLMVDESELMDFAPYGPDGFYMNPEGIPASQRLMSYAELLDPEVSASRPREHTTQCDHCGAHLNYVAVYRHLLTGHHIVVGHECADNTMGWSDRRSLDLARQKKAMAAARKNAKEQKERALHIANTRALFPEAVELLTNYEGHNSFIRDVATRFTRWGTTKRIEDGDYSAQEKVMKAVLKAHARDQERDAEKATALDVPEGRMDIEGEVISVKPKYDYYGDFERVVMTVKHADGWLVWGTCPAALLEIRRPDVSDDEPYHDKYREVQRGERVRFRAKIARSDKDPKFGFFSRPTKAEVIQEGGEGG